MLAEDAIKVVGMDRILNFFAECLAFVQGSMDTEHKGRKVRKKWVM